MKLPHKRGAGHACVCWTVTNSLGMFCDQQWRRESGMSVCKYKPIFLSPHLFHLQLFHSNPAVVRHPVLRQLGCCAYSAMVSGHVLYRAFMPTSF